MGGQFRGLISYCPIELLSFVSPSSPFLITLSQDPESFLALRRKNQSFTLLLKRQLTFSSIMRKNMSVYNLLLLALKFILCGLKLLNCQFGLAGGPGIFLTLHHKHRPNFFIFPFDEDLNLGNQSYNFIFRKPLPTYASLHNLEFWWEQISIEQNIYIYVCVPWSVRGKISDIIVHTGS